MEHAVIITIGDEILSGNTMDTNSNFIASELKNIGISVVQIVSISDDIEIIKKALKQATAMADLVITTGGLGPTKDDKTKVAFAEFFQDILIRDPDTYQHLSEYLIRKDRAELLVTNATQADVLSKAIVLQNENGTAPCQLLEYDGCLVFSLPGVPYEVKPLIKDKILGLLKNRFDLDVIVSRIVSVVAFPESLLAERIADWEDALPKHISLSYLPIGNRVKLRLTAKGKSKESLNKELEYLIDALLVLIGDRVIGTVEDKIEKILAELLTNKQLTLAVTESCTGGEVARLVTSISGSSKFFVGGIVSYATEKKIELLKVSKESIAKHTVVSESVALEMARGGQQLMGTDICISTTGVAGPLKGEDAQEVGTVYYAIRIKKKEKVFRLYLPYMERIDFMNFVAQRVLQDLVGMLYEFDRM